MRKPPSFPPPDLDKRSDLNHVIMTRHYKLITPLFGGGVEAGKVDLETPIRGSTVRGQLRFWWRATRGGQFDGDLEALKIAEDAIWGSTKSASKVSLSVKMLAHGKAFIVDKKDDDGNHLNIGNPASDYGYVAFPLRPTNGTVRDGIEFELTLRFPDAPKDLRDGVQAAVWAWETFGGIGARTRRGFGALSCIQVRLATGSKEQDSSKWTWLSDSQSSKRDMMKQVRSFVHEGKFPRGVPYLSRQAARYQICIVENSTPHQSWVDLIAALKAFRQNRAGKQGFGRSNWPEPDAILDIINWRGRKYTYDEPVHGQLIKKFPRAQFGLPIVYEFHADAGDPRNKDIYPPKTTLTGEGFNRLASPLIIRPLQCRDQGVGLAVVLEGSRPWHHGSEPERQGRLVLREGSGDGPIKARHLVSRLTKEERDLIKGKHTDYDGHPDILHAFLKYLDRSYQ